MNALASLDWSRGQRGAPETVIWETAPSDHAAFYDLPPPNGLTSAVPRRDAIERLPREQAAQTDATRAGVLGERGGG